MKGAVLRLWPLWLVLGIACSCGGLIWSLAAGRTVPSVVRVSHDNPILDHAIDKAKEGLPMFTESLKHRRPGDQYAIKARFETAVGPEYLWLKDPKVTALGFEATIDQQPMAAKIRKGERVKVARGDVIDWMVQTSDGQRLGAFTDLALQSGP